MLTQSIGQCVVIPLIFNNPRDLKLQRMRIIIAKYHAIKNAREASHLEDYLQYIYTTDTIIYPPPNASVMLMQFAKYSSFTILMIYPYPPIFLRLIKNIRLILG